LQLVLVVLVILLQQMVVRAPLVGILPLIQLLLMVEVEVADTSTLLLRKMAEMVVLVVVVVLDILHKDLVAQEIRHQPAQVKEIMAAQVNSIQDLQALNMLAVAVAVQVKQELLVEPHQTKVKVVMEQPQLLLALL
jgi:hypothetical protein